jgi:chromate transporter
LSAITAVVVGVIASLALFFAGPVLWPGGLFSPWAAWVVAMAVYAQLQLRWSVLQLIGVAAGIGAALAGVSRFLG